MNRVSAPVSPPSRLTASKYSSSLARSWPPSASPNSFDHSLQVRTLMSSKYISPNSLEDGLQVHLQTCSITASKGIFTLAQLRPLSVSPISLNYGLQVCTITASECISKFTRSRCGETVELEGRQPTIHTPQHLAFIRQSRSGSRSVGRGWEDMKGYPAMMNQTNWMDLWKLGKGVWDQDLGKKQCEFHIMWWCLSTPVSPKYIVAVAESVSVIPVSPYVYI